MHMLLRQTL